MLLLPVQQNDSFDHTHAPPRASSRPNFGLRRIPRNRSRERYGAKQSNCKLRRQQITSGKEGIVIALYPRSKPPVTPMISPVMKLESQLFACISYMLEDHLSNSEERDVFVPETRRQERFRWAVPVCDEQTQLQLQGVTNQSCNSASSVANRPYGCPFSAK